MVFHVLHRTHSISVSGPENVPQRTVAPDAFPRESTPQPTEANLRLFTCGFYSFLESTQVL